MLEEFAAWYLAQWRDLIPERWRGAGEGGAPVLLAEPDRLDAPGRFRVTLREDGRERLVGALEPGIAPATLLGGRPRPPTLLLRLPAAQPVLSRDVTLPLAAERDLAAVLGFEMDRLTPFAAAELRWGYAVTRRDRAAGRLMLRLSLVPRDAVERALAALGSLGLRADALEGLDADGARRRIPLAHDGEGRLRREHALAIGAWAVVGALALLVIALPFLRQDLALSAAAHRIAALRPAMRQADAIRARIEAATAGADVLAAASRDNRRPAGDAGQPHRRDARRHLPHRPVDDRPQGHDQRPVHLGRQADRRALGQPRLAQPHLRRPRDPAGELAHRPLLHPRRARPMRRSRKLKDVRRSRRLKDVRRGREPCR